MKKMLCASLLLCISLSAFAQWTMPPKGKSESHTLESQVLNASRNYTIYLPKSYTTDTTRTYPILYLFHGMSGTHDSWEKEGQVAAVANKLIDSGDAVEMIIVTPDAGGNVNTCQNGFFDMKNWPYETFFFTEFMPYIETHYRVKAEKAYRGISGLSMGGGGCTRYAQIHPELFNTVYAMSALMDIDQSNKFQGLDPNSLMGILTQSVIDNSCIAFVENADEATKEKLKTVHWFVDCGDDDFLLKVNLDFFWAMKKAGIPLQFRMRDGGHDMEYWKSALYIALPYFSNHFGR